MKPRLTEHVEITIFLCLSKKPGEIKIRYSEFYSKILMLYDITTK